MSARHDPRMSKDGRLIGCSCGDFTVIQSDGDVDAQWADHTWQSRVADQLRRLGAEHRPRTAWERWRRISLIAIGSP